MASDNDEPTEILANGTRVWRNADGKPHRDEDKYAMIFSNGDKVWCRNGFRHRDGYKPAVIYSNGKQEWYQNGIKLTENEVKIIIKHQEWMEEEITNMFQWLPIEMNVITDELLRV